MNIDLLIFLITAPITVITLTTFFSVLLYRQKRKKKMYAQVEEVLDDYVLEYIYSGVASPAEFPEEPTRDGYTFVGWFDALYGGNEYDDHREEDTNNDGTEYYDDEIAHVGNAFITGNPNLIIIPHPRIKMTQ